MSQATIAIPPSITEGETRLYLSMKLFEIGRLSCGQAAELAGYYPGTEEAHTNPTRQRGECLRALAGASG
jgi:predicted HTH domain antitoxin